MSTIYFPTTDAQISNAFVATLGAAPGSTYLALAKSMGVGAAAQVMINATGKTTASALADTIVANLGLTGDAATSGKAYLLADIAAKGGVTSYGSGLVATLDLFASLTSDATYGSFAQIYVARVNASISYSATATNNSTDLSVLQSVVGSASAVPGTSLTSLFTVNPDDIRGTAGNDSATVLYGGASATLGLGDIVNLGAGTDTLNFTFNGTGGANAQLDGVEVVNLRLLVSGTADMSSWSGTTTVNVIESSIGSTNAWLADPNGVSRFNVDGGSHTVNIAYVDGLSGTNTVTLAANSAAATFAITGTGVAETLALVGSASSTVNLSIGSTGAGAVTVTGSGTMTANFGTGANVSSITTTGFVGSATYSLGTGAQHIVTGGGANETFDFGGAGGLQSTGSADTVNGGGGTDEVKFVMNGGTFESKQLSNVEVLTVSAINGSSPVINASGNSGVGTYNVYGTGAVTVNSQSGDATVNILSGSITQTDFDVTSGNLTVRVGSAAQSAALSVGALSITDASAVTLGFGGSNVTHTLTTVTLDSDAKVLTVAPLTASATLNTTSFAAPGLNRVDITTSGSGAITNSGAFLDGASSLSIVNITAAGNGAGDIALGTGEIGSSTAVSAQGFALSVSATDSADFGALPGVRLAAAVSAASITINLGSGSVATTGFGTAILTGGDGASVGSIYVSAGDGAALGTAGAVTLTGTSTIGGLTLRAASAATIGFADINARDIGSISITTSGEGTIRTGTIGGTGNLGANAIGSVTVNGTISGSGAVTIGGLTGSSIGNISLSDTDVTISDISSTGTIGGITISARGDYNVSYGVASAIGDVNAASMASGATLILDLNGVNRGANVILGSGTNTVTEGTGQNTYTLAARTGTGADTIVYSVTGASADSITGFGIGSLTSSAGDVIRLNVAAAGTGNLSTFEAVRFDNGSTGLTGQAATAMTSYLAMTGSLSTSYTFGTASYVVISGTAFANATAMVAAIGTGGDYVIGQAGTSNSTAGATSSDLLVIWTDGSNSYLTVVDTQNLGTALVASNASASNLASLQGVSAAGLAGWNLNNIDFE